MASFEPFKHTIQQLEGGYQNIASDKGNYNSLGLQVGTKYGISAKTYEQWIGYPPSITSMKAITKNVASEIFKAWYWNKVKANQIFSQSVAENIVDHAINAGVSGATKIVQRTLNSKFKRNLSVDGIFGNKTLAAVNSVNESDFFKEFSYKRIDFYKKISDPDWIRIWLNRVYSLANKFNISLEKKK